MDCDVHQMSHRLDSLEEAVVQRPLDPGYLTGPTYYGKLVLDEIEPAAVGVAVVEAPELAGQLVRHSL